MKRPLNFFSGICVTGVAVRIAGDGEKLMHNKFYLIDVLVDETKFPEKNQHSSNGLLINGSLNWTTNVCMV